MTITIDRSNYLKLLTRADISPKLIESEAEYRQFLVIAQSLIAKFTLSYYRVYHQTSI